jgi:hypothetical protein
LVAIPWSKFPFRRPKPLPFYHPQQRHYRARDSPRPVAPSADGAGVHHGKARKGSLGIAQIGKRGAELIRGHGEDRPPKRNSDVLDFLLHPNSEREHDHLLKGFWSIAQKVRLATKTAAGKTK